MGATWLAERLGRHRVIGLSLLLTAPFALLTPLIDRGSQVWLAAAGYAVVSVGAVVFNVAQVSARQVVCPDELLGRMNATLRFLLWGSMPLGALLWAAPPRRRSGSRRTVDRRGRRGAVLPAGLPDRCPLGAEVRQGG